MLVVSGLILFENDILKRGLLFYRAIAVRLGANKKNQVKVKVKVIKVVCLVRSLNQQELLRYLHKINNSILPTVSIRFILITKTHIKPKMKLKITSSFICLQLLNTITADTKNPTQALLDQSGLTNEQLADLLKNEHAERTKFVLYTHRGEIEGYRQMTEFETRERMYEISEFYERNRGFVLYNDDVDISNCGFCTIDNMAWSLKGDTLESGDYDLGLRSCKDNQRALCYGRSVVDVSRECLKKKEDFDNIYYAFYTHCQDETKTYYAVFINTHFDEVEKPSYIKYLNLYCSNNDDEKDSLKCQHKNIESPFYLSIHNTLVPGYRQLKSDDLKENLLDYLGDFYAFRKGFLKFKERLDINKCSFCTADNKAFYDKNSDEIITSASFDMRDKPYNDCTDNKNAMAVADVKSFTTNEDIKGVILKDSDNCKSKQTYAIFVDKDISLE